MLKKTTTKITHTTGTHKNTTRRTACLSLDLHTLKQTLIEVEWKRRRKTPHHRKKAIITNKHRQIASQFIKSIVKRAPALSPRIEGAVPIDEGALTLELEMQPKAKPSKKREI